MGLEGLFLDEALEADVTLEGSDAVVDEHVPLQVGRQGELPGTHITLVAFHPLWSPDRTKHISQSQQVQIWASKYNKGDCKLFSSHIFS